MAALDWTQELDKIFVRDGAYILTNSPRWWQARRGRLTASGAPHTLVPFKDRGINTLMEKLREQMQPGWVPKELSMPGMEWGREYERAALSALDLRMGTDLIEPGTLFHPELSYCSATPDGIIDGHISVQTKCPHNGKIHLDNLYNHKILRIGPRGGREKYWYQVQWEAWVAQCDEILFVSFDPQQPMATRLSVTEVPVDLRTQEVFYKNAIRFRNLFESGRSLSNTGKLEIIDG